MEEARTAPVTFEPWNDPNETPYVRIERVTKKFGEFVAVAVVVENGGGGSKVAAPIAREVIEAYLADLELASRG